jgi:hypothetical protein
MQYNSIKSCPYVFGAIVITFSGTILPWIYAIESIQQEPGYFSGVKRQGHEVNHLRPFSGEVKNKWIYASTPPIRLKLFTPCIPIQYTVLFPTTN